VRETHDSGSHAVLGNAQPPQTNNTRKRMLDGEPETKSSIGIRRGTYTSKPTRKSRAQPYHEGKQSCRAEKPPSVERLAAMTNWFDPAATNYIQTRLNPSPAIDLHLKDTTLIHQAILILGTWWNALYQQTSIPIEHRIHDEFLRTRRCHSVHCELACSIYQLFISSFNKMQIKYLHSTTAISLKSSRRATSHQVKRSWENTTLPREEPWHFFGHSMIQKSMSLCNQIPFREGILRRFS